MDAGRCTMEDATRLGRLSSWSCSRNGSTHKMVLINAWPNTVSKNCLFNSSIISLTLIDICLEADYYHRHQSGSKGSLPTTEPAQCRGLYNPGSDTGPCVWIPSPSGRPSIVGNLAHLSVCLKEIIAYIVPYKPSNLSSERTIPSRVCENYFNVLATYRPDGGDKTLLRRRSWMSWRLWTLAATIRRNKKTWWVPCLNHFF